MQEYSYTSTHPLSHTGPVTGSLYLLKPFKVWRLYDGVYFAAFLCQTARCHTTNGHVKILNLQFFCMTTWATTSLLRCYIDADESHEQVKKLCLARLAPITSHVTRNVSHWSCVIQFNSIQFNSIQFNSIQFSSVQFSSVQFSSVQFSSIHFSSIQFNSIFVTTVLVHQP